MADKNIKELERRLREKGFGKSAILIGHKKGRDPRDMTSWEGFEDNKELKDFIRRKKKEGWVLRLK